jgi:hypothetical protein
MCVFLYHRTSLGKQHVVHGMDAGRRAAPPGMGVAASHVGASCRHSDECNGSAQHCFEYLVPRTRAHAAEHGTNERVTRPGVGVVNIK